MIIRLSKLKPATSLARRFSTTPQHHVPNRIYDSFRNEQDFQTAVLLSSSSRKPLITLWTASWSPDSRKVAPIIQGLLESHPALVDNGIGYAEVEIDAPDIGDLAARYLVNEIPTLLAFDRQEPQMDTRVTRVEDMKNQKFLVDWILKELARGGKGGGGGSLFGGLYGRLRP